MFFLIYITISFVSFIVDDEMKGMKTTVMVYKQDIRKDGNGMEKYIVDQDCSVIRYAPDCMPIQVIGNQIFGVGYSVDDYIQQLEDMPNKGMKEHLIELGLYESEDRAKVVMIQLYRWLNNLEGLPIFIMPEYTANVDLIEKLGGVDE